MFCSKLSSELTSDKSDLATQFSTQSQLATQFITKCQLTTQLNTEQSYCVLHRYGVASISRLLKMIGL